MGHGNLVSDRSRGKYRLDKICSTQESNSGSPEQFIIWWNSLTT